MNVLKPAEIKLEAVSAIAVKPDIVADGFCCNGCSCSSLSPGALVSNPILRK